MKYRILKEVKNTDKPSSYVTLIDTHGEVLEYDDKVYADNLANIFKANSGLGLDYIVLPIGS